MKIITGDEAGLAKTTTLNLSKAFANKKLKSSSISNATTTSLGKLDKSAAIGFIVETQKAVFMARLNAVDCIIDSVTMSVPLNLTSETVVDDGRIAIVVTNKGSGFKIEFDETKEPTLTAFSLGMDNLCAMAGGHAPLVFATGGKERDLCLWSIENLSPNQVLSPIWTAKNVPNDYLDLRVPVWVSCIQFDQDIIVVGTGHGGIRVYKPLMQASLYSTSNVSRRPISHFTVFETSIKALTLHSNQVICADTMGNVKAVDLTTGKQMGSFRGLAGAVTCMKATPDYLITAGLDRFLRVFEISGQRRMVEKVYLKQRLSSLLVQESEMVLEENHRENVDDLFQEMEKVSDRKRKVTV